jgi:hypothetical protein
MKVLAFKSIGVRGLSPNRSWELNTRQNGYDISSDVFGYPAYYNPPMEAVEIELFVVAHRCSLAHSLVVC